MFSLLNLISGFIETGAVIFALSNFGAEIALVSALLYQIGNLVPFPIRLSKQLTLNFAAVSIILMLTGMFVPVCGLAAVPFLSAAVQSVRAGMKTESGKTRKRVFRILGFLLGFSFQPVFGTACAALTLCGALRDDIHGKTAIALPKFGKLQAIMVLHQMHYFVYCYAVMITAYQFGGALLAAGLFFAGWLAYVFVPRLYKNFGNYRRIFLFGHSLLFTLLLTMFFAPSLPVKAFLWLLTGFGGTTEFCIKKLETQYDCYNELNHNCAENFGHILGVIACLPVFMLSGGPDLPILLSALFAVCAAAVMMSLKNEEALKNEYSGN